MTLRITFNARIVDQFGEIRDDATVRYSGVRRWRWCSATRCRSGDFPIDFVNGRATFDFSLGYSGYYDRAHTLRWIYFEVSTPEGLVKSNTAGPYEGTDADTRMTVTLTAVVPREVAVGGEQPSLTPGGFDSQTPEEEAEAPILPEPEPGQTIEDSIQNAANNTAQSPDPTPEQPTPFLPTPKPTQAVGAGAVVAGGLLLLAVMRRKKII